MSLITDGYHEYIAFPEPRRRIRDIAGQLIEGKTIIWFFPETIDPEVYCQEVLYTCESAGMICKKITLMEWQESENILPAEVLAASMIDDKTSLYSIADIMAAENLPEISLVLGVYECAEQDQELWCKAINEWVSEGKKNQACSIYQNPAALLIPLHNTMLEERLVVDVFLGFEWFWGWYSQAELRLIARSTCRDLGFSTEGALWAQYVFVELAGLDPDLLKWLLLNGSIRDGVAELINCLCSYGEKQGWDKQWLTQTLSTGYTGNLARQHNSTLCPPRSLIPIWEKGILNGTPEDGILLSSAALAMLGRKHELEHRVWTGQARLLLPLLDEARRKSCLYLLEQFQDWSAYCKEQAGIYGRGEADEIDDSGLAEYATIEAFLNKRSWNNPRSKRLLDSVHKLRSVRNQLAHYRSLSGEDFINTLKQINVLHNITS
ncbi:MAG: hypothetical protein GXY49_05460 [Syntrophomonadaceae bacterium]|nr:hypothetical protein [Syntrophomonadaceae bacterium]